MGNSRAWGAHAHRYAACALDPAAGARAHSAGVGRHVRPEQQGGAHPQPQGRDSPRNAQQPHPQKRTGPARDGQALARGGRRAVPASRADRDRQPERPAQQHHGAHRELDPSGAYWRRIPSPVVGAGRRLGGRCRSLDARIIPATAARIRRRRRHRARAGGADPRAARRARPPRPDRAHRGLGHRRLAEALSRRSGSRDQPRFAGPREAPAQGQSSAHPRGTAGVARDYPDRRRSGKPRARPRGKRKRPVGCRSRSTPTARCSSPSPPRSA